jgi:hypothetical protein
LTVIAGVWPVGENVMATRKQIAHAVDSHLVAATTAGRERRRRGELAVSADYDPRTKRLRIELASGVAVCVPISTVQGLADIAASKIKSVQIDGNGYGLHWPEMDLDVSVPGLIAGCFGTRVWMTALARHGGKSTSAAKASAARKNGKKGGRPRTNGGQTTISLSRRPAGR